MPNEEDEDEEICCRICRNPSTPDHVLFTPCKCSGSIRYVHEDCLVSWLNLSSRQTCELCGHKFQFRPVYADNAPQSLPLWELAWILAKQSWQGLKLAARMALLVAIWGFTLPLLTSWAWRMSFYSPLRIDLQHDGAKEAFIGFRHRLYPFTLLADIVQGLFTGLSILFIMVFISYIADHTRQYWQLLQPAAEEPAEEQPAPPAAAQPPNAPADPHHVAPAPNPNRNLGEPQAAVPQSGGSHRGNSLIVGAENPWLDPKREAPHLASLFHQGFVGDLAQRYRVDAAQLLHPDVADLQHRAVATSEGRSLRAWSIILTGSRAVDAGRLAQVRVQIFANPGTRGIIETRQASEGREWRITLWSMLPYQIPTHSIVWTTREEFTAECSTLPAHLRSEMDLVRGIYLQECTSRGRICAHVALGFTIANGPPQSCVSSPAGQEKVGIADSVASSSQQSGHAGCPGTSSSSMQPPASRSAASSGRSEGNLEASSSSSLSIPGLSPQQLDRWLSHVIKIAATQAEDARRHPPPDSYSPTSLSIFPQDLLIDCDERSARLSGFSSEQAREGHRALQELFGTDLKYVIHMEMTCLHFERLKLENLKLVSTQSRVGETDDARPAQPEAQGIPVVPGPEYQHPERVAPAQQGQPAPPERPIMLAQPPPPPPPQDQERQAAGRGQGDDAINLARIIGLEGPLSEVFVSATLLLMGSWCFLACTLWIPFMVGKLMQFVFTPHQLPWLQLPVPEQHRAAKVVVQLAEWFGNLNSTKIHAYMQSVQSDQNSTSTLVTEGASSSPLLRRVVAELEADLVGIGLEDWVCLGLGYGVLFVVGTLVVVLFVAWKVCTEPGARRRLRNQGDIITEAYAKLARVTVEQAGYILLTSKVMLVLFLELILLPTAHGCWVDFCLLPLFGSSWRDRLGWLQVSPISFSLLHWALGMATLMGTATLLSLLRKELRPGALPFFKDPFDREDEPIRDMVFLGFGQQIERQAFALTIFATLAVIAFHLPLKLARLPFFGVVPLRSAFFFSTSDVEVPPFPQSIALILYHFVVPWTLARMKFRLVIVTCLRTWLQKACQLFELSDLLLSQTGNHPPAVIPRIPFNDMTEEQRLAWTREMEAVRGNAPKLLMMLFSLLGSIVAFNTSLLVLPILTGRHVLGLITTSSPHDIICFSVGIYILWGVIVAGQQLYKLLELPAVLEASEMTKVAFSWLQKGGKLFIFGILGIGVLPLLIGLLFEHLLLPIRMHKDTTPAFYLYSDWASGMIFLRTIYQHLLRPVDLDMNPRTPMGRWLLRLRLAIRVANAVGVSNLSFSIGIKRILWPLIQAAGLLLVLPFVVTKGLLPRLPWVSVEFVRTAYLHAWWAELLVLGGFILFVKLWERVQKYRASVRDRLYLERRELVSLEDSLTNSSLAAA